MKNKLATSIVTVILILSSLSILATSAHGISPTLSTVNLPAGSNPIAIANGNGYTYYASNSFGHIWKVDSLLTATQIYTDSANHHWIAMVYSAAIYPQTPALYLVDSGSASGNLYRFDLNTNVLDCISDGTTGEHAPNTCAVTGTVGSTSGSVWVASQCQSTFNGVCTQSQSFIYSMSGTRFFKVENLRDVLLSNPNDYDVFPYTCGTNAVLCSSGGTIPGVTSDSSGNIYFTDQVNGKLYIYTAGSNSLSSYSGFTNPTGVAVVGSDVYVTQNILNGKIDDFSLTSHSLLAPLSSPCGTPFAVISYGAVLACSSNGSDHQICVVSGQCVNTGEANYYMLAPSSTTIFFGFIGSSGVGEIDNLPSASTTSSTASSQTSSSSTSSGTSTSASTSSTASATNECGGSPAAKCVWTPIVIPFIHVDSIQRNGSVATITGFEAFLAGPSSGDFFQMISLVGCCAMMMNNLNPSNGTFATMNVTARPYNTNNYPDTPTPAFVMDSPIIPTSATKFGWFCNNQYIVDYVLQCDGNSVPVNYRTFSFTAPTRTIVSIEATGTESEGQVSIWNVFL